MSTGRKKHRKTRRLGLLLEPLKPPRTIWKRRYTGGVLAPVRSDRISAGKTPAPAAGFVVGRHAGANTGDECGSGRQGQLYKVATLLRLPLGQDLWNAARVWYPA
jgi:hypothetical protein